MAVNSIRRALCATLAASAAGISVPALAQKGTAAKPIRIIVPWKAGGPLDIAARAVAEAVYPDLGTVIVENKPGAGGNIGVSYLAKQPADGMTWCVGAVATHAINPYLFKKLPYDPNKDFQPLSLIAHVPNVLCVTPEFAKKNGIMTAKDLIALLKKNPDKFNYASGGNGSAGHLAGELLKMQAGVKMVHVPYQGAPAAKTSVLSGENQMIFDNLASATAQIKGGKFMALAVTTPKRAAALPDVPTMQECGVPGFDISTWYGLFAPAKTPKDVTARLNAAIVKALKSDALKAKLAGMGAVASPTTPDEFAAMIRKEQAKYEKVVKACGAHVD